MVYQRQVSSEDYLKNSMNKNLEKYVLDLSKADKKRIEAKALKVSEECGELADRVLAYSSSPQSLHKVVTEREILEESVDVTLSALSIPLSIGFSFEDIYDMMDKKCGKWAELQSGEKADTHMFEIHLYTKTESLKDRAYFSRVCQEIGVKPIYVENAGIKELDVMTSSRHYGSFNSALSTANILKIKFGDQDVAIYRTKIETIPSHPASKNVSYSNNNFYMEAHIQVFIPSNKLKVGLTLKQFLKSYKNTHLSKNPFKKLANGYIQMVTLRAKVDRPIFEMDVNEIYENMLAYGLQVIEKPEIEFCIFDDNKNKSKF